MAIEWISVEDRLPDDDSVKLVWSEHFIRNIDFSGCDFCFYDPTYEGGDWWHFDKNRTPAFGKVTHWAHRPEPPRVQASAIEKKKGE